MNGEPRSESSHPYRVVYEQDSVRVCGARQTTVGRLTALSVFVKLHSWPCAEFQYDVTVSGTKNYI